MITDFIGNTPLVEIKRIWTPGKVRIFAKVEGCNPGGSIKDRVAYNMITQAIKRGQISLDTTVLEATSGNTGIGLAMVCASLGLNCVLVMPMNVSVERVRMIKAYGAQIILVRGNTNNAIKHANNIYSHAHYDKYYMPNQFDNPDNYLTHFFYTASEIIKQLGHRNPTHFVSAIGTTGTIRGCAMQFAVNKCFHKQEVSTKIIAVSPKVNSKIQGLKNLKLQRVPKIYNLNFIDKTVYADDERAFEMTRRLAREEGLFCGMSSGAAMDTAVTLARRLKAKGEFAEIVVILPDSGDRYLSEKVFK